MVNVVNVYANYLTKRTLFVDVVLIHLDGDRKCDKIKGTISNPNPPNFAFFQPPVSGPRLYLQIQRELHWNKLPMQQFSWKHGIRDNSLLFGINFRL